MDPFVPQLQRLLRGLGQEVGGVEGGGWYRWKEDLVGYGRWLEGGMMDPFVPQLPRLLWGLGQEVCGGVCGGGVRGWGVAGGRKSWLNLV